MEEFLKITKSKIVIFVLLVVLSLFLIYLSMANLFMCKSDCPIPKSVWVSSITLIIIAGWPFLLVLGIEKLIFIQVDWIHPVDIPFIIVAFAMVIFWQYLLACIIEFGYRKIKKR